MADLTRRRFLGIAGGTAGALVAGGVLWNQLIDDQVRESSSPTTQPARSGRILVVVEMAGGNDGLNTLVPADGRYRDARPTLAMPEAGLVALEGEDGFSLHPALAGFAPLWAAGDLAAVHGLGFENQTRSHFAAMDVWHAGGGTDSWLGRWLDATGGDEPAPLRAVALGSDTRVLAAEHSLSTVIKEPSSFNLLAPPGADEDAVVAAFQATAEPLSSNPTFAAAQTAIPSTIEALGVVSRATEGTDQTPPDPGQPARKAERFLDTAARIIDLDVGTEVFVIGLDGFDTHATQADRQQVLLDDLNTGVTNFLGAMEEQGRADDVLVLITSEFGRRVAENGSDGTDHGKGNVLFAVGKGVNGQIVGAPPLDAIDDEGDLPVEVDARSLYAVGLDWLGGPTDDLLGGQFDRYGLI